MSSTNGQNTTNAPRRWPLFLIAAPAAVAVWSGWVGLGDLCGFGVVHPLPGIWGSFKLNTAITLPVGVESYGAYALAAWLLAGTPARAREFARLSAIGALALGCLGQVAYHLLAAAHMHRAPWPVTMAVACLPVVTLSFAAALTHLLRAGDAMGEATMEAPVAPAMAPPAEAIDEPVPEAIGVPSAEAIHEPPRDATAGPPPEATDEPSGEPRETPRDVPPKAPAERPVRLADDEDATAARAAYRKSIRAGSPLSDRALGELYGRGRTWGANRIKEVNGGPKLAKAQ